MHGLPCACAHRGDVTNTQTRAALWSCVGLGASSLALGSPGTALTGHGTHRPLPCSCAGYIGEFEVVDDHRSGKIVVDLIGRINKCGVISPRFDVCHDEIEQWVVNLLPARTFGHIILTTSYGIMDHEEARRKHTGGKILGFFY